MGAHGFSVTVADARFAKPIDLDLLTKLASSHKHCLIVEEGSPGGFAAHAVNYLANHGYLDRGCRVRSLTLPDVFIDHDSQDGQLASAGLDAAGILASLVSLTNLPSSTELASQLPAKAGTSERQ